VKDFPVIEDLIPYLNSLVSSIDSFDLYTSKIEKGIALITLYGTYNLVQVILMSQIIEQLKLEVKISNKEKAEALQKEAKARQKEVEAREQADKYAELLKKHGIPFD
jgi:TRAP-type mannitol/chloroaromatic compound transport system permease large subunit